MVTQVQGRVRIPKNELETAGGRSTFDLTKFSLIAVDGSDISVVCSLPVRVAMDEELVLSGVYTNENMFQPTMIRVVAPNLVVSPTVPPVEHGLLRMVLLAIAADVLVFFTIALVNSITKSSTISNKAVLLLAILASFPAGETAARLFHGKMPAHKTWITGLVAMIIPLGLWIFN